MTIRLILVGWYLCYLRPVRGCTRGGCEIELAGLTTCFGLLTLVLDFANSSLMVWGKSGSNLTPCCKKNVMAMWQRVGQDTKCRKEGGKPSTNGLLTTAMPSHCTLLIEPMRAELIWLIEHSAVGGYVPNSSPWKSWDPGMYIVSRQKLKNLQIKRIR